MPVFKKSSANEKVTILLETREIADKNCVAGVVVVEEKYLSDRSVFIELVCSFRYGREEDQMFGMKFLLESIVASQQLYPPPQINNEPLEESKENGEVVVPSSPAPATKMQPKFTLTTFQERLLRKFGSKIAFPFHLAFHSDSPLSVSIESGKDDKGKSVGLEYFLKVYTGEHEKDYSNKNGTVQMVIKKVQLAPQKKKRKDSQLNIAKVTAKKEFFMSKGELELHVSLDKQIYYHGDTIKVVLLVNNKSSKTVRKYKTSVEQLINMSVFKNGSKKNVITSFEESEYGVPIPPGGKLNTFIHLTPTLGDNKGRPGIAKDGQLRNEEGTTLASSSLFADPEDKDAFGIVVGYYVKVKLYLSGLDRFGGDLTAKVPFFLMHPPPGTNLANKYRRRQSLYY